MRIWMPFGLCIAVICTVLLLPNPEVIHDAQDPVRETDIEASASPQPTAPHTPDRVPVDAPRVDGSRSRTTAAQGGATEASESELRALVLEVEAVKADRRRLVRELDECRYPELSPLGAFVRLPEYDAMSESTRHYIRGVLEEVPALLRPGEGAWLAERVERSDWRVYGSSVTEAVIIFLGGGRVAAEIPPEKLDALRQWYDEDEWARLFGNR